MADKTTLRIRFTLNRGTGQRTTDQVTLKRKTDAYAATIVRDVGIKYAENSFNYLRSSIRGNIILAVEREINNMVMLYKQFIVDKKQMPGRGTLTTVTRGTSFNAAGNYTADASVPLSSVLPKWAPRSEAYLKRKQREIGTTNWFMYSGYLGEMMSTDIWLEMFGPIVVRVKPIKSRDESEGPLTAAPAAFTYSGNRHGKMKFGVASISVSVFGYLTPSMLPALASGQLSSSYPDGRMSGLIDLVHAKDPKLAYHLAGNSKYVPYRASIEPFLSFCITRSVPSAVFARLDSTIAVDRSGSAGRV